MYVQCSLSTCSVYVRVRVGYLSEEGESALGGRVVALTERRLCPLHTGDVPGVPRDRRELRTDVHL